jgi:hypothetical protein
MTVITPTSSVAPAGWYRDPLGIPQLRWWNGLAWTNHIQEDRPEFQPWSADFSGSTGPTAA